MNARQRRKLFAGVGLVSMLLGALMAVAPIAGADDHNGADPHGNNGTVKIDGVHELDGPGHGPGPNDPGQHPDNDPHVECAFELEFFGFDEGQTADVTFTSHAPTGKGEVLLHDPAVPISADPAGGAGNDPDVVVPYDLTDALESYEPHDVHGWHVKLQLTIYEADGTEMVPGGKKHKVFWVEGCEPEPQPTYSVSLVKTNDANDDEVFTDSEQAPAADAPVEFQVAITNTGTGDLTLASLTDTWPGQSAPLDLLAHDGLECTRGGSPVELAVGSVLPAGSTTTCTFTVAGYAPDAGGSLVNTVTVDTDEDATDEDTSTVTTPTANPTFTVSLVKTNDADDDGVFTDSEQAPAADAPVEFQVAITNTGTGDLTLASLTDTWPGQSAPLDLLALDGLACTRGGSSVDLAVGSVLPAGSTTTCTFTVAGYAPDAGGSLVNTVTVDTDEDATDEDTSTVSTPVANPTFTVSLVKTNDANDDEVFNDSEQAPAASAPVEFQVAITNTGTGHLSLTSLVDTWPGQSAPLDLLAHDGLACTRGGSSVELAVGSVLPAGTTTTCRFTVAGYAPAAGGSLTNTVTVDTAQEATDADTSTVTTGQGTPTPELPPTPPIVLPGSPVTPPQPPAIPPVPPAPPVITPVPPVITPTPVPQPTPQVQPATEVRGDVVARTLPRTGDDSGGLAALGTGLLAMGAAMVLGSRLRFRRTR